VSRKQPGQSRFKCGTCGQEFFTPAALVKHVDDHRKQCDGNCKDGKK
jgi:hypothetical protein